MLDPEGIKRRREIVPRQDGRPEMLGTQEVMLLQGEGRDSRFFTGVDDGVCAGAIEDSALRGVGLVVFDDVDCGL